MSGRHHSEPPEWLSDQARDLWNRAYGPLERERGLRRKDRMWFEMVCSTYPHWKNCIRGIAAATTDSERDALRHAADDCETTLLEALADVGFDSIAAFEAFVDAARQ